MNDSTHTAMIGSRPTESADLRELGEELWQWRAQQQPCSRDDIPRIERPVGWLPSWSEASVSAWRSDLEGFERRWAEIDTAPLSTSDVVDYHLVSSALSRVRWELDHVEGWRRNPSFHLDQAVGVVFDLLLPPPPFDDDRTDELLRAIQTIPERLEQGRSCLDGHAAAPFADIAREELRHAERDMAEFAAGLVEVLPDSAHGQIRGSATEAGRALGGFRDWLRDSRGHSDPGFSVGRESFEFFLREVALWPYSPEDMLEIGRREFQRSIAFERWAMNRHRGASVPALPDGIHELVQRQRADEQRVRDFYVDGRWLSQPSQLRHYLFAEKPRYMAALEFLGAVSTDHTSPSRLHRNGTAYTRPPTEGMPYFFDSGARDPRTAIVHEGVHYQQLALSYGHPNPLRRHYYDSGPNEGIAFYNEEWMLQAGLFDDEPWSEIVIYNMVRLRALRVEVDVRLSIDDMDIVSAARYLIEAVPLDRETAEEEAHMFASTPGQGLTYQIGKSELIRMQADAILADPEGFSLQDFHDYVWMNGNVPFSLQRLELLDDASDLAALGKL